MKNRREYLLLLLNYDTGQWEIMPELLTINQLYRLFPYLEKWEIRLIVKFQFWEEYPYIYIKKY